jgi:heme/copper-type cytochrome/quinol oxidase subunit 1
MKEKLKKLLIVFAILSIPAGFFAGDAHAVFWWRYAPLAGAMAGGIGAVFLMLLIKVVASFTSRKEDFYD